TTDVFAGGVSPYLPLNISPEIERQIERVLILAEKPVMTRPIAVATVLEALHDAREKDEELYEQVKIYLMRYTHDVGIPYLSAEVSVSTGDSDQAIPNQHGKDVSSSWEVSGDIYYRLGSYVLFNLGGIAYDGNATPTGSMLSIGIDYAQLDIGYRDHWLSPFTDSSALISTEAPTMPSITLSNYRPISRLGLSYEIFLAEMSESSRIAYQDSYTTGKPRLAGVHLQAEPVSGIALGINRQLQYSGGERDNDGFGDFVNALLEPSKYDNTSSSLSSDQEFGNQQASLTARILFPGRIPFAAYFEYAGEDTSRYNNYLLGNTAFSLGIDFPLLWKRFQFTFETTEWQNGWYVHHVYGDGLTNKDRVTGHWFGDQREFNENSGGMSHMLRAGFQLRDGAYLQGVYRTLKNEPYSSVNYERMQEIELSYSSPWHGQLLGVELDAGRDIYGEKYVRLSASVDLEQDRVMMSGKGVSAVADMEDLTDVLLDIGMTYSMIKTDRGNWQEGEFPDWKSNNVNAHLGLGARRYVSEHGDLGVRVEWDRIGGHDLISARIADYRYRIVNGFALDCFFGVGRYDFGTAAYGWYMGMGPQFLNLLPKWDLCIDGRFFLKMVRDKLLESDPPGISKPDVFNVAAMTVYLSRRF
ncbi:MAG: hypothetical protein JW944_06755, partial [Deltaproteobacteria bacterium]|nr:hypothetical protein [Deltaproteobacteria bacterium]